MSAMTSGFRATLVDAATFWERRRLAYNGVLCAVVVAWVVVTWPHLRPAIVPTSILPLLVLALLANACYSTAYLAELAMAALPVSRDWRGRRPALWLLGTLLASLLACYWIADEIYPTVA